MCGTKFSFLVKASLAILCAYSLTACGEIPPTTTSNASCINRVSTIYAGPAEPQYCAAPIIYGGSPEIITGTATYQTREYTASNGIGAISAPKPIRRAEVVVVNAAGSTVQCGTTTDTGTFSLAVPTSADPYSVIVRSRANNDYMKASVLNCPEENQPYGVKSDIVADGTQAALSINAGITNSGPLLGAAFNILDQIYLSNEFLRTQTANPSFVAPKVQAYWAKGFNPNMYYNAANSGISFYIPNFKRLFILGGISGDIYNSDTDHFDNSIIVHEYGHFLEDALSKSDSPGGAHSGNAIIDPRLAWSEGWGNFLQAAVTGSPFYRDSDGTPNASSPTSTSSYIFNIGLETATVHGVDCATTPSSSGCDIPTMPYEGNFREFSITRALWDMFDSNVAGNNTDGDTIQNVFAEIWQTMTTSTGFLNINAAFRNIGLFYELHDRISGTTDLSSIQSAHYHGDTIEYARYLIRSNAGTCIPGFTNFTMNPLDNYPTDNGTFPKSHLLRNNNFYHYKHAGGAFSLVLETTTPGDPAVVREPDLDLYLYSISGRFGNSSDILARDDSYWDNNPATQQIESLNVSNLPPGNYLINTKIFTGRYLFDNDPTTNNCIGSGATRICENDPAPKFNFIPAGNTINYVLRLNGVALCPAILP